MIRTLSANTSTIDSVLCVNKITDAVTQVVVFQNFKMSIRQEQIVDDFRETLHEEHRAVVKARFLLLEKIRRFEIRMTSSLSIPNLHSLNSAKRASTDHQRRTITEP